MAMEFEEFESFPGPAPGEAASGQARLQYLIDNTMVEKHYGQLPEIKCMPSQLNQMFMNLLVNAARAMAGEGRITIRTGAGGSWAWVAIGCGIAPANLNRIFEPFFTTKPVGTGTGHGLSLS